jgi:hypothetical protein
VFEEAMIHLYEASDEVSTGCLGPIRQAVAKSLSLEFDVHACGLIRVV